MNYTVWVYEPAKKDMKAFPMKVREQINEKIELLAENPRPMQSKKLEKYSHQYRLRVGDYRVKYEIDDKKKEVLVLRVAHRKEVYR